ncbi:MAG: hypothetical protein K5771_05400 [Oscillospiraceae bacterium]|nr:hypothetical protein [Oscillospiraceae bacterium]
MTNNTVIRLFTLTFIVLCFCAMILTASLCVRADIHPDMSSAGITELAGDAVQYESQLTALSAAEAEIGTETPSM